MAYMVSPGNVNKVKDYFVKAVKDSGSKDITMRVDEIASYSGVSLATAHKALLALQEEGFLEIIKPASRRYTITYRVVADVDYVEKSMSLEEQLKEKDSQIRLLMEQNSKLLADNKRLNQKVVSLLEK
jgi:DNA-binding IclR family transcriptional regulator